MRKVQFFTNQFYHIYNRGNNKRSIFQEKFDLKRFLQGLDDFNSEEPIGSIYEKSFKTKNNQLGSQASKLVNIIAYCLNPNHFHLVLEQIVDNGITKFMHRQGTGYVKYFNEKYKLSGSLFQGPFKAIHVDSNEYLLHLSTYVNLNKEAHGWRYNDALVPSISSWDEYVNRPPKVGSLCNTDPILSQFKSSDEYRKFALDSLETIRVRKEMQKSLELELLSGEATK
ncbi:MAG: transposase [Parcubacteria group bacterium]|nr:transposase [Parcubacteria group bacterium]